uniref:Mediator of RNA polymerase II transcription subunit 7 n=1 Tax=Rhipicephalus zambeziensis TaxID=60191 RepID=A0A224Z6G6_9ACAR
MKMYCADELHHHLGHCMKVTYVHLNMGASVSTASSHFGYSMFGAPFHGDEPVIRPLESQGIRRLYPQNYEHKKELKKLNHSLLVNFLDMVDILIRCPDTSKRLEKKEDMSLLFIHMHHLINEYRPHQARETLRVLLDMQRRQRLDTAHRFHKHLDKLTTEQVFAGMQTLAQLPACCITAHECASAARLSGRSRA